MAVFWPCPAPPRAGPTCPPAPSWPARPATRPQPLWTGSSPISASTGTSWSTPPRRPAPGNWPNAWPPWPAPRPGRRPCPEPVSPSPSSGRCPAPASCRWIRTTRATACNSDCCWGRRRGCRTPPWPGPSPREAIPWPRPNAGSAYDRGPSPVAAARSLIAAGLARPLALTRSYLVLRGDLAGIRLAFDGTPLLDGLGRAAGGGPLP